MTLVRIVEQNWEDYSGHLGDVEFVNGVSVEELFLHQVNRIASAITIISVTKAPDGSFVDGEMVGPLSDFHSIKQKVAEVAHSLPTLEELGIEVSTDVSAKPVTNEEAPKDLSGYSREELETIADSQGIKGLREIAESQGQGIKGKSVEALIDGILES